MVSLLSFHLWYGINKNKLPNDFQAAFDLCATGTLFIFLGAICGIIYAFIERKKGTFEYLKWVQWTTMALYFGGGFFYWIGGCVLASAYNSTFNFLDHISAFSGIWFAEITFISTHAIIAGIFIMIF